MIKRLPEDAQTLYAETLALLLAFEAGRGWPHLSGSFSVKAIKGAEYVYFQYSDPGGRKRQFSIGVRSQALDKAIGAYTEGRELHAPDLAELSRLSGLLRSAGIKTVAHGPARVLRGLSDAGVFQLGGVLLGSLGFQVMGNLLGVTWPDAAWRTQDIDIAGHLKLALPDLEADVPKALDALEMGFVPVPQFDPRHPSSSFRVRGKTLRVDLITPGGESDDTPIFIHRFRAAAAPIKYLSLVMRGAVPALALESSSTLVVVPSPARFALHKLLVSQRRSMVQQTKSGKDIHQAALLLELLAHDRPEDLEEAALEFTASGPAVSNKIRRAFGIALKSWPEIAPSAPLLGSLLEV